MVTPRQGKTAIHSHPRMTFTSEPLNHNHLSMLTLLLMPCSCRGLAAEAETATTTTYVAGLQTKGSTA